MHDEHPAHRHLRMLGADLVFQTPVVGDLARKTGIDPGLPTPTPSGCCASGELIGVLPEGFKGVGKPYSDRYKLQRFGRGGFVSAALRTGTPIIPLLDRGRRGDLPDPGQPQAARPADRRCPTSRSRRPSPWLGPLGLIPLPSKWLIEFGAPIDTASLGRAAADDPMVVFDLTDQVRETIQQTLYALLMQRRSVFF